MNAEFQVRAGGQRARYRHGRVAGAARAAVAAPPVVGGIHDRIVMVDAQPAGARDRGGVVHDAGIMQVDLLIQDVHAPTRRA